MRLLISNGHLIDPAAPENTGMSVLVEDGKVSAWFGPNDPKPEADEVFDAAGKVVLMTGRRYRMCPAPDDTKVGSGIHARSSGGAWVIGEVDQCLLCELGGYGYPFDFVDCTANPTNSWCKLHERPGGPSPTPPQPPP